MAFHKLYIATLAFAAVALFGACNRQAYHPLIVTTTDVFEDGYSAEIAASRLASLGYEGIDMGFDYWTFQDSPFRSENYMDWARGLRAHADEVGIPYTHAHAPGESDSDFWLERSIEASAVLGVKYLVVHPIFKIDDEIILDRDTFISANAEAIRKWLPLAQERDVVLLSG